MTELPEPIGTYLRDPSLAPLWAAARVKLERSRLAPSGAVVIALDQHGADRLGGLLGARVDQIDDDQYRVRLPNLDAALRRSAAQAGLVAVLEQLGGGPLVDRTLQRAQAKEEWVTVWVRLDAALATAGLAAQPWVPVFLEGVRRSGLLTRAGPLAAASAAESAARVLAQLGESAGAPVGSRRTAEGPPATSWLRAQLASQCLGSAHGLDDGKLASALVLRAAAAAFELPVPAGASARREAWGWLGVSTDQVSGTVLAWGLRPPGERPWAAMMRERASLGVVTHLTAQELDVAGADRSLATAGQVIFVCENPQVVQAAAAAGAAGTLLCTAGNPASAWWTVLRQLVTDDAEVRYHGDFDWPGLAIAGRVFAGGARPWRLSSEEYTAAIAHLPTDGRLELAGTRVATPWDPRLAERMAKEGVAVHEEFLLDVLVGDLDPARPRAPEPDEHSAS